MTQKLCIDKNRCGQPNAPPIGVRIPLRFYSPKLFQKKENKLKRGGCHVPLKSFVPSDGGGL